MGVFLYLGERWYADSWINGGVVPIKLASTYRSAERSGIYTPDENVVVQGDFDLRTLSPYFNFTNCRSVSFSGGRTPIGPVPDFHDASFYEEDGLILSFSSRLTGSIARKMNKKCCVRILDVATLKQNLDKQLGVKSVAKFCSYTDSFRRDNFLKSTDDEWQAEYRVFWPGADNVEVEIPTGTAELVIEWT